MTIAKVRGAARGGGCEFLLALDMRFAALGRACFGFPEVSLGILAAGGGPQLLPAVLGRSRALEMLLGGRDLDAVSAERYGLVDRAVPDEELDQLVDDLARRVASWPPDAVASAKLAVSVADTRAPDFALEAFLLDVLKAAPATRRRLGRFIDAGGQTAEGEKDFRSLIGELDREPPR